MDYDALVRTIKVFEIENPVEFVAQCAHESAAFRVFEENLNYSLKGLMGTWPSKFKGADGEKLAKELADDDKPGKAERIVNCVYEGKNGNTKKGDGYKYRGRGIIQITGKENYKKVGEILCKKGLLSKVSDLLDNPDLLAKDYAYYSAGAFWSLKKLNAHEDNMQKLTKAINGGSNGLDKRILIRDKIKN